MIHFTVKNNHGKQRIYTILINVEICREIVDCKIECKKKRLMEVRLFKVLERTAHRDVSRCTSSDPIRRVLERRRAWAMPNKVWRDVLGVRRSGMRIRARISVSTCPFCASCAAVCSMHNSQCWTRLSRAMRCNATRRDATRRARGLVVVVASIVIVSAVTYAYSSCRPRRRVN